MTLPLLLLVSVSHCKNRRYGAFMGRGKVCIRNCETAMRLGDCQKYVLKLLVSRELP